ncbi:MAG TPA: NAD(P)/FAD-dependent oxidoreductase [Terriglobales bacterium]|nr:NAD(P)/FAD-dependent oxidoreductase [Terriglobales bacterium]
MAHQFDVLVLGAGAAGLMCAIEAGKRGRRVAVFEHADGPGKKILISGGGRCNFTHTDCQPENFISANPHFAKSALARYTPADFVALVEKYKIPYHEKTRGQLFCDDSARDILKMLERECEAAGVKIFLQARIREVSKVSEFVVHVTQRGEEQEFRAAALVVATGGLSIPKMGATSVGFDLARQFGLKIREPRPALVPLLFNTDDLRGYGALAGVSTSVRASANGEEFSDKMLFTHRGLSGPAILQISSYWESGAVSVDLAPGSRPTEIFNEAKVPRTLASVKSALHEFLPARLADRWLTLHPLSSWTNVALAEWERQIHSWDLVPSGTEGYAKAEVTAGGVDTDELSAKSMESTKVSGLFFIGEVVDVTGQLGGFNFQWAWSSGAAAGRAV